MRFYCSLFLCLILGFGYAQEIPPLINFDPNVYTAGNQNWMISQGENKNLYVANGSGLLEYTGAEWNLYSMPNNTIVRSVKVVGDLIFTGAYMEVGYWREDTFGILQYTSLLSQFPDGVKEGEQFWHIERVENVVVFQSFEGLYTYNIEKDELLQLQLPGNLAVSNLFKVEDEIFFQLVNGGLYKIEKGLPAEVVSFEQIEDLELMHVYRHSGNIIMITQEGNFFFWNGSDLEPYDPGLPEHLEGFSIFSAIDLPNGALALGTVEDGLYYIDPRGEIHHFNQQNGFLNNTVLSIFLDKDQNLWAGLDNGISVINLDAPFRYFQDYWGKVGSVYTSFQEGEYLYLGTNQGLYYRKDGENEYHFIEGTNGQVWSLQHLDGNLFCGHNKGTYLVEGETAKRISDAFGTWTVEKFEGRPGYYLQGHYNGFSLLKQEGENFSAAPVFWDFPHSSKYILSERDGDIWIGNEHKGVYRMRLNDSLNRIAEQENFPFGEVSGITSSIFKFNDTLYYATKNEVFQYNEEQNTFRQDSQLASVLGGVSRISGKVIKDGDEAIWAFTKNAVLQVSREDLSLEYALKQVHLPENLRNSTLGYENITHLGNGSYMMGLANGYLQFDKVGYQSERKEVRLESIAKAEIDESPSLVNLQEDPTFHYKSNNVSFTFSIPEYKEFLIPAYSYRLIGQSDQWSAWENAYSATFENLPYGEYEFEVRGRIGEDVTPVERFSFEIARPWFLSYTAFGAYFVIFLGGLGLVHQTYKRKHQRLVEENEKELRMKNLEAEQEIIKLQKEQLEKDMINKNKELAVTTMSLIKKNEFLANLKSKLGASAGASDVTSVIRTIDQDISEEDNWNFFKEAFNNADKDFFKKMKTLHPELTSNDLKLCAYLRLNLTSKEIAPLLNISVKSVEIKRYRLRKKMELSREVNLTDYILEI